MQPVSYQEANQLQAEFRPAGGRYPPPPLGLRTRGYAPAASGLRTISVCLRGYPYPYPYVYAYPRPYVYGYPYYYATAAGDKLARGPSPTPFPAHNMPQKWGWSL